MTESARSAPKREALAVRLNSAKEGWLPDSGAIVAFVFTPAERDLVVASLRSESARTYEQGLEDAAALADERPFSGTDLSRRIRALKRPTERK